MIWILFIIFTTCLKLSNSLEGYYQPPRGSSVWGYFTPPLLYRVPTRTHQTAMDAMVDLTNNLGVTILKDHSYSKGNFAFSPYGVASVLVVLYEGACGESASQIHRALGFPFDKDVIRVGFRSIHRHLRSYFSHEGYLSGISLNKEGSALKPEFKRILKFYGYDVDVNHPVDEDISLEDLASPATPSGEAIANSNVTSPSPGGVTENDIQSMNNANTTGESDGNKENNKDVTTEPGDEITEKPESTTKDGNESSEKEEERPDEAGDDHGNDKETEKPEKSPEDDVSIEGNKEKPDKVTEDVDSAEREKETPEMTTEDADDSSATQEAKPDTTEKNQNNEKETENSDKTSTEKVEEDKENSDTTSENASDSSDTEKEDGSDGSTQGKEDNKEIENSDKTSTQESDTTEEDKQKPEDGSEEPNDTVDGQDDNKETENQDKTSENDNNTSQEDKENSDSATEDHNQLPEKENEKVCVGKEDCENKTEDSTKTTTTTPKQEPEEMSITTLSEGLILNKTEPTEEVDDLQITSSTIKNSDENSENSETGVPTSDDSMSENLESPLTSTMDPLQEEEITKGTESTDTEKTTTTQNLDNGMLIPQSDDLPTDSESSTTVGEGNHVSTTPETTEESKTDTTEEGSVTEATTSKPHSRRKRNSPVDEKLRPMHSLEPMNKISVWGQMKLAGIEPSRHARQAFHPKLSATYRMRKERTIADYLKWPPASDVSLQLQNGMFDSHVSRNLELYRSLPRLLFLVDGAIDTPVPMMTYTHTFPYAYIPRLHTKALEFPLDDVRYKLLILLPVERRGLRQLIYDLTEFPLREVFTSLQPTRVRAMIPPFMVEGFVILTSSLQKLGIWDVFDPRKSNLSGMSIDPELYVRNVEQSVTVVIRNYVEILDIQTRTMAARNIEHDFEATHPFLYFVLDTATNVALMAGQILDPLNSRIY